jgi:3-oxoacyl-[acyl-carrier protein] reductase
MSGKVAAITGAASGIGESSAEVLAAAGCAVILGDIDPAGVEKVAQRIVDDGGRAIAVQLDARRKSEIDGFVDRAVEELGRLDVMANIAGIGNYKLVVDVSEQEMDDVIAVNQKGVFFGCQAAMRVMMPQRSGSIINIASAAIDHPATNVSVYAMTKAAVAMLTMELAVEAGPHGIRVNCLAPGSTVTNFGIDQRTDEHGRPDAEKVAAYLARGTNLSPLGLMGEAIDQAYLVHYLASDASKFATGGIFRSNGGVAMVW